MQINKTEVQTSVHSAVWREEVELSWITFISQHNVSVVVVLRTADVCDAVKYFMTCVCFIKRETDDKHHFQYVQMSAADLDNFSLNGFTMLDTTNSVQWYCSVWSVSTSLWEMDRNMEQMNAEYRWTTSSVEPKWASTKISKQKVTSAGWRKNSMRMCDIWKNECHSCSCCQQLIPSCLLRFIMGL